MSDSSANVATEKDQKSVHASDDDVFYEPRDLSGDNDDTRSTAGTDDGFFDSHEGLPRPKMRSSDEDLSRANSPEYLDDTNPYTQLKNLKGLSSPSLNRNNVADDNVSLKESVVSSLSSHSEHNTTTMRNNSKESDSNEAPSFSRDESSASHKGQRKISFSMDSIDISGGQQSGQQSPEGPSTPKEVHQPIPKRANLTVRPEELSAFNYILSSEDDIGLGTHTRVTSTHRSNYKCEFKDKLKLVQTVAKAHTGPIWTMKFNHNGQFLATGGADSKVFIWCVAEIPKRPESKVGSSTGGIGEPGGGIRDSGDFSATPPFAKQNQEIDGLNHLLVGPFLLNDPYRSLIGHDEEEDITDISWSRSGSEFLLTASTDRKVCLWNVHESQYIQYFRHNDVVTAVEFDPHHDRYFISACFDHRIRVWDIIPHGSVKEFAKTKEAATALAFSPSGHVIAAGLLHGQVTFLQYDGMRYITQMDCKNRNGKFKNGAKVTGITYIPPLTDDPNAAASTPAANNNVNNSSGKSNNNNPRNSADRRSLKADTDINSLLISTNDHRIRLCTTDYRTHTKFKGLKNKSMQIKATTSEDNSYVICGSDTGAVFIWRLKQHILSEGVKASRSFFFSSDTVEKDGEYEAFDGVDAGNTSSAGDVTGGATMTAVTCAIFAPALAMKRFLRAQASIVPEQSKAGKQRTSNVRQSNSTATMDTLHHYDEDTLLTEFSTRIIVTADTEANHQYIEPLLKL